MLSSMAASTFLGDLISQLKSLPKDNSERKQTKNAILNSITKDPDSALVHLSQISHSFPHLRSKCFSLLCKLLFKKNPAIHLKALIEGPDLEDGKWTELLDYIGSSVNSKDERNQDLGLGIFLYFPETILEHLGNHFDSIRSAVFRHMASTHWNLRKLAWRAAVNLSKLDDLLTNFNFIEGLVPRMIGSINEFLEDEEYRKIVLKGFKSLVTVVMEQEQLIAENVNIMFDSMLAAAEREKVTSNVKEKAFEAIQEIDKIYTEEVTNALENLTSESIERCFLVWMNMLTLVVDVPGWHNVDAKDDVDKIEGETLSYGIGKYFLERISLVNTDKIWPIPFGLIEQYVADDENWKRRLAGINMQHYVVDKTCRRL